MLSKAVDIIKCTSLDSRENPVVKAGVLVIFKIKIFVNELSCCFKVY